VTPGGEPETQLLPHNGAALRVPESAERDTEGSAPGKRIKSRSVSQTGTTTATDSGSGTPLNGTAGDFKSDFLTSLTVCPVCRQIGTRVISCSTCNIVLQIPFYMLLAASLSSTR